MNKNCDKKNVPVSSIHQEPQTLEFIDVCEENGWKYPRFFARASRRYTPKNLAMKERRRQILYDLDEFYNSGILPEYVIRLLRDIVAIKIKEQNAHKSVRSKPLQYLRPSYTSVRW